MSSKRMLQSDNGENNDEVEMSPDDQSTEKNTVDFEENSRPRWFFAVVIACILLFVVGLVCIIIAVISCSKSEGSAPSVREACQFSPEAKRLDLKGFLKEAQLKYFEMNPYKVAWQPDIEDFSQHIKTHYLPYNPDPMFLKKKTDASIKLLNKINNMNINTDELKPREAKAVAQVKHFLQHTFGTQYDQNYYAGDWMLGPNQFCWMIICVMSYDVNALAFHVKPATYGDVEYIIRTILKHKQVFDQYRSNVALGITTGMVRTKIDCRAGVESLKVAYRQLSLANNSNGVLQEWYTKLYQEDDYFAKLTSDVDKSWQDKHAGKNVSESIKDALVQGVGQPLLDLLNYLEFDHMRHCLPNDVASGLGGLPVDYVYTDGIPNKNNKTTKKLPTGQVLNGTNTYRLILSYFTTTDISPEEIYEEGKKQLDAFYAEIINITKQYTGKSNETEAVAEFKKLLNSRTMWHNNGSFPSNESDKNAFTKCVSPETAAKYCPVRWAAMQRWAWHCREVMSFLAPKQINMFYNTGTKATTPNCPIDMLPQYNPALGAQFFKPSDAPCSDPTYFGLPFFLKDYGPVFQEWSVTAHESRPGHLTQVQGHKEHFKDTCGGVPGWFDSETYYTAFTEGWGLYSENPLISDDTDTYKTNLLQKYGMLKWQAWRAVRLIVDTGLHARRMSRTQALKMFEDYAWDTSDFAVKEVTRYQSVPGQATSYMLGRLELIKMRKKAEKELGSKFNLKDFHYQVLKQGSAPLAFLHSHIDRYIKCAKGESTENACQYILPSTKRVTTSINSKRAVKRELPPRPPRIHYV